MMISREKEKSKDCFRDWAWTFLSSAGADLGQKSILIQGKGVCYIPLNPASCEGKFPFWQS